MEQYQKKLVETIKSSRGSRPKTEPNQIGSGGPPQLPQPPPVFQQVMQDVLEDFVSAAAKSEKGLQSQIGQTRSSLTRKIKRQLQRQRKKTQQTFQKKLKLSMKRMRQRISKMIGIRVKKLVEEQMKKLQKSQEEPPRSGEQGQYSYADVSSQEGSQSYMRLRNEGTEEQGQYSYADVSSQEGSQSYMRL